MRALVTGVAGFAGSHLAELLLSHGVEVYGLIMPGGSRDNLQGIRGDAERARILHLIETDLAQEERLADIVREVRPDRVYHLAALSSVRQSLESPGATLRVNVLGTRNLLEAVRRAGMAPRLLLVSSAEAYGESASLPRPLHEGDPLLPVSPYGASKAAAEAIACRYGSQFGLQVIRVRPFPHTGPRHSRQFALPDWACQLAEAAAGRRPARLQVGNLDIRRDLSDVRDTVAAYILALEQGEPGAVYNVCSERVYSLRQVLDILIALSGVEAEVVIEPERLRSQDLQVLAGTAQALHARTGWEATTPLRRTLEDLLSYWRAKH